MKLGQKVMCSGYLVKIHFDLSMLTADDGYCMDGHLEMREFVEKNFKGIVVQRKTLPMRRKWVEDGRYYKRGDYVKCYQVFYSFGRSRIVPIDKIKENEI